MRTVIAAAAVLGGAVAINNGRGVTPPLGWRSWNLYGGNVDQDLIVGIMDGMVNKKFPDWTGKQVSLWDLGFRDVGLDDNWQQCGAYGPNKWTFHDANGWPVVNRARFPNFLDMTDHAHSLNLTAGWYGNNCICSDHCSDDVCYLGDVDAMMAWGFDSVKLDGCGQQLDLQKYADLFNATGKSILIESCHWGDVIHGFPGQPNATWCPFNYYRSSGDIAASYDSIVGNLQTTIQWAKSGLSYPGCWAYPDMLEVGCAHGPHGSGDPGLSFAEARSHFGAWCVVSSPLILSHDVNNDTISQQIWPIISNSEALAVNQAWYGFSGSVFKQSSELVQLSSKTAAPTWQYWYKPISATQTAVLMMNHAGSTANLPLTFTDVPALPTSSNGYKIRDLWNHADLGSFTGSWTANSVATHDSAFIMITAA